MKIIALDYDDTYTSDPDLWDAFVALAQARGHAIVCVTFRFPTMPIERPIPGVEVFYTGGAPKARYMEEQQLKPDIWIDDWPELIGVTR